MQLFTNVLFTAQIKAIHPCPNKVCKIKFRKWRPVTYRGSLNNAVFGTTIQIRVIFKHCSDIWPKHVIQGTLTWHSKSWYFAFEKCQSLRFSRIPCSALILLISSNGLNCENLQKVFALKFHSIFFYSFYTISWIAVCFSGYFISLSYQITEALLGIWNYGSFSTFLKFTGW